MPPATLHLRTFASPAEAAQRLQALREVHGAHLHLAAEAFPALVRFTYLENLQLLRDALPPGRRVSDDTLRARLTACGLSPEDWPTANEAGSPLARLVFLTLRATVDPEAVAVLDLATGGRGLLSKNTGASLRSLGLPAHSIDPLALSAGQHPAFDLTGLIEAVSPLANACRRLFIFTLSP